MEQRKDLKIQPVQVASTDPAFISGLMSSGRDEHEDQRDDAATDQTEQDDAAATADADGSRAAGKEEAPEDSEAPEAQDAPEAREAETDGTAEDSGEPAEGDTAKAEAEADDESGATDAVDAADAEDDGKPSFEAEDRRGSIGIDAGGVRFTLDDQAAEWTWEEIAAVEFETSRFGRRLTVTAHTPDRRWYPAEVQAPDKRTLKEWEARLDEVLDAYFEEESVPGTDEEPDVAEPEESVSAEDPAAAEDPASAEEPTPAKSPAKN